MEANFNAALNGCSTWCCFSECTAYQHNLFGTPYSRCMG